MKTKLYLTLLLLPLLTSAYITPTQYRGISIRSYADSSDCITILDRYPTEWLTGIKSISVLPKTGTRLGTYYFGGIIYLYSCDTDTVSHELAHHQQYLIGDTYYNAVRHIGTFQDYYLTSLLIAYN